jgi:HEAT repeat protein
MKRPWQFGVRQLLVFVTLLGLLAAGGWYWREANRRKAREEAVQELVEAVKAAEVLHPEKVRAATDRVRELGCVNQAAMALADISVTDEDFEDSYLAAMVLSELGPPAVTHVLNAHDDPKVHLLAVQTLFEFGPQALQSAEALKAALDDPDDEVRIWAAAALVKVDCQYAEVALPTLFAGLEADEKRTRTTAAYVVALVDPKLYPRVAPTLLDLLDGEDYQVRNGAAFAIGSFGVEARSAVPLLINMLREEDATWAVRLLVEICGPEESALVEECLLAMLASHEDSRVRALAAEKLGKVAVKTGDPQLAVRVLINALNDPTWDMRLAAAISLGDIGPAAQVAIPALTTALNDDEEIVRKVAAAALDKIQGRNSAP